MASWYQWIVDATVAAVRWLYRRTDAETTPYIHETMPVAKGPDSEIVRQLMEIADYRPRLHEEMMVLVEHGRYAPVIDVCATLQPTDHRLVEDFFEDVSGVLVVTEEFYRLLLDGPEGVLCAAIRGCFDTENTNTVERFLAYRPSLEDIKDGDDRLTSAQFTMLASALRGYGLYTRIYPRLLACFPRGDFCAGHYNDRQAGEQTTLLHVAVESNDIDTIRATIDHVGSSAKTRRDSAGLVPLERYLHLVDVCRFNYGEPDFEIVSLLTVLTKGAYE